MEQFKIGDNIERIKGDARHRGTIIEIDETKQRARIEWTHHQRAIGDFVNGRITTEWTREFIPVRTKQPRTWTKFDTIIKLNGAA